MLQDQAIQEILHPHRYQIIELLSQWRRIRNHPPHAHTQVHTYTCIHLVLATLLVLDTHTLIAVALIYLLTVNVLACVSYVIFFMWISCI